MKILLLGVFSERSTNVSHSQAFQRLGHDVIEYPYRERAAKLGESTRDEEVMEACRKERADLVLFSKCNQMHYRVVEGCKQAGAKTVLWYMDPMGNFDNELKEKIKRVDIMFVGLTKPFEEARKICPEKVFFVNEGFDPLVDRPVDVEECRDVSFIGSLYGHRASYHKEVGFDVVSGVYGREHAKAVCESRINLNFTQGGTSDRTYKVLAAGGFLLTQTWPGMEKDFEAGKHLDTFESVDELRKKIKFWLGHESVRLKVARAANRVVQKFVVDEWAKKIVEGV